MGISFEDFIKELQKELKYQLDGGTSYRKQTVSIASVVAMEIKSVKEFLDREVVKQKVSYLLPTLSEERIEDVAKLLYMVASDMQRKSNLPDEVKAYVQQKRENQKPLLFRKKQDDNIEN